MECASTTPDVKCESSLNINDEEFEKFATFHMKNMGSVNTGEQDIYFEKVIKQECDDSYTENGVHATDIKAENICDEIFFNELVVKVEGDSCISNHDCTFDEFHKNSLINRVEDDIGNKHSNISVGELIIKSEDNVDTFMEDSNSQYSHGPFQPSKKTHIINASSDERLFECNKCKRTFKRKWNLKIHMLVHSKERLFECEDCGKVFKSLRVKKDHYKRIHSDEKPVECNNCKKTFKLQSRVKEEGDSCISNHDCSFDEFHKNSLINRVEDDIGNKHSDISVGELIIKSQDDDDTCMEDSNSQSYHDSFQPLKKTLIINALSDERPFECNECKKTFKKKSTLKTHMVVHSEERPFECEDCGKGFKTLCDKTGHRKRIHSDERPFECNNCKKTFKLKSNLTTHMLVHSEKKPFECEDCGKAFKSLRKKTVHYKQVHIDVRPYECSDCKKAFKLRHDLLRHVFTVHSNNKYDERPFECNDYKKTFKKKLHLKTHMLVHSEERPFECENCGKAFKSVSKKRTHHKRVHSGGRPFECNDCKKSFKTKTNLKIHMLVHSEERPFKCENCGKAFKSLSEKKEHYKRIHSGERPFECNNCKKTFIRLPDLKIHMLVHSEERLFKCEDCGKGFKTLKDQKVHRKRVHLNIRPYECSDCKKTLSAARSNDSRAHCSFEGENILNKPDRKMYKG